MDFLIKPIVTEKTTKYSDILKCFAFEVPLNITKQQVKKKIETVYKVKVLSVNTLVTRVERKTKYTKKRLILSKKSIATKKVFVKITSDQNIDFYS